MNEMVCYFKIGVLVLVLLAIPVTLLVLVVKGLVKSYKEEGFRGLLLSLFVHVLIILVCVIVDLLLNWSVEGLSCL